MFRDFYMGRPKEGIVRRRIREAGYYKNGIYHKGNILFEEIKHNKITIDSNYVLPRLTGQSHLYPSFVKFIIAGSDSIDPSEKLAPAPVTYSQQDLRYKDYFYVVDRETSYTEDDDPEDTEKPDTPGKKGIPMFFTTYPTSTTAQHNIIIPEERGNESSVKVPGKLPKPYAIAHYPEYINCGLAIREYTADAEVDPKHDNLDEGWTGKYRYFAMQSFPQMIKTNSLRFEFTWQIVFGN